MRKIAFGFMLLSLVLNLNACAEHKEQELTPEQYMKKIEMQAGVKTLPSGLAYQIIRSGDSKDASPAPGDLILLEYEGRLPDGVIFDSSDKHGTGLIQMPLDGLIPGWMETLPKMHPGDIWKIYVPPQLGYGNKSMGIIPSNSPLVFKIHLVGVTKAPQNS
ncbi:hypothetical protein COMNV_01432 [Commensalibacter sp. Nvir]|uniref:FKBP-type peptidyl-prolyl cis-trans isomerase n=1 Tax=Commensalibacter sp. Nvir TaxID=3069817 RepID=UPI002D24A693|nr:hypothetical protein COMNV_01432 [Commensalibacter sp. Nvir]